MQPGVDPADISSDPESASDRAPKWWQSTSIYQIYPRSFADSNGDGIGDLEGIISRLDYLADLGVGAIWVSPFFTSPQRDVGYDVADYRNVSPEYGTIDDAQRLIDEAHARGLRVLFDLVLNHTSDQHLWFVESRSSRTNPKADWYVWADARTDRLGRHRPPNNWRSELQVERAWRWCPEREQYFLASFLDFQPDLNWRNPAVRAEMFDMVRMWLGRGVDGFRLDIFGSIMQDAALRNNPPLPTVVAGLPRLQRPVHTLNTTENFELAADLREVCDEFGPGERVLLGEVFGDEDTLARYVQVGDRPGLHVVFLFEFLHASYSAKRYRSLIERFERRFPAPQQPTYVVENHDRARSMSRLGGDERKARVLATLMLTLRGIPVIFQGQEVGMTNKYIPLREAVDPIPRVFRRILHEPLNRRLPERLNRDEVRVPMQWSDEPGVGFTDPDVTPWLRYGDDAATHNVSVQNEDPASLLNLYRELYHLRREYPAIAHGSLELVPVDGGDEVIAYRRGDPDQPEAGNVLVVCNLGDTGAAHRVEAGAAMLVRTDDSVALVQGLNDERWLNLPPHSAAVLSGSVLGGAPHRR